MKVPAFTHISPFRYALLLAAPLAMVQGIAAAQAQTHVHTTTVYTTTAPANPPSMASACTAQNLSVGVQVAQSPFYREFHNQDLVRTIADLRRSAETDMRTGNLEACGLKAATIQAMVNEPAKARVTFAAYRSQMAAHNGTAVQSGFSVPDGRHVANKELMGMPLLSLDGKRLGTISGVVTSRAGHPLYLTVTPQAKMQATTPTGMLHVPVSLLLVNDSTRAMYVGLNRAQFLNEPRFRAPMQP